MTGQTTGPTLIQSVQRALRLLEMVAEFDGRAQAKELARAAGFTLPTTYHLLRTMTHEGYLQRLDDGGYVLGHRLDVVLRHGTPSVRPDDVLRGLTSVTGIDTGEAPLMTRLSQGPLLAGGEVGDPLVAQA